MLKPCPQTKTFSFALTEKDEAIDQKINDWKKSITKNGDHVCPNPPSICCTENGYKIYVYTYSIPLEVAEKKKK